MLHFSRATCRSRVLLRVRAQSARKIFRKENFFGVRASRARKTAARTGVCTRAARAHSRAKRAKSQLYGRFGQIWPERAKRATARARKRARSAIRLDREAIQRNSQSEFHLKIAKFARISLFSSEIRSANFAARACEAGEQALASSHLAWPGRKTWPIA